MYCYIICRPWSLKYCLHKQRLIQKEKIDIDGEKSVQIRIVAKKTVTQRWLQIVSKQATHYNYFVVFALLSLCYVTDMIKKQELCLLVVIILFKIEFWHAQISVLKSVNWCQKQPLLTPDKKYYRQSNKILHFIKEYFLVLPIFYIL